jgi:RNA polymerase sigma-70 factor (ECF subfamily)
METMAESEQNAAAVAAPPEMAAEVRDSDPSPETAGASNTTVAPSFEQVFADFAPYVLRVLPRLGVRDGDVEDVCQEVFIAVHRKLAGFEGRSKVRTWLYGICLRVASNYRQRASYRREVVTDSPPEQSHWGDQLEHLRRREAMALLDAALSQLNEREREVVVLYEIEQLGMSEVADAVGCRRSTAYARLYAARHRMKKYVRRLRANGRLS